MLHVIHYPEKENYQEYHELDILLKNKVMSKIENRTIKSEILTNAPKRQTGTGSGYYAVGVIRPFQVSSHSAPNNTGVKFGGKIAFDFDKSQGDYIKVKIHNCL